MLRRLTISLFALLALPALAMAQTAPTCAETGTNEGRPSCVLTDASLAPGSDIQLDAGTVYILRGVVAVEGGGVLRIPAGTIIKAESGTSSNASALLVARDAQIFAEGTASNPIIFTSIQDNLFSIDFLNYQSRGLWGGVVMLGQAGTNNPEGLRSIEGINEIITDGREQYGGTNDNHSSGVFRYVSIRHTGINVGLSDGNEIQGLTLGAVGRGTTIEYVESYSSGDDGFEFFGGTVDTRYLVSAFNSDDAFDWDEGFRGRGQFWFAIQGTDAAGALAEQDGGNRPDDSTPFAIPVIYNATYIGAGVGATPETDRAEALYFRDNSGGKYLNSIVTEFQTADGGDAVRIENRDSGEDSNARLAAGDLVLSNNIWWDFGDGNTLADIVRDEGGNQADIIAHLTANSNVIDNPLIAGIERDVNPSGGLDPRPNAGSPAYTAARAAYSTSNADGFFREVSYIGAFGANNWLTGWTALDNVGYIGDISTIGGGAPNCVQTGTNEGRPSCVITDASVPPGSVIELDAGTTYILRGVVVVENGGILRIPAGTIIKAESGTSSNASALVVARDAQIFAEGTASNPIIFTSIQDNLNGPDLLTYQSRGLWGGVVILGQAGTNNPEGLRSIEGVNEIITDGREQYGGTNDNHSSGVFRYVSIRHTGINVGLSDGNEIQGLTLGAVGRGTTIEWVESYSSGDDGFEFFGGTVDTRYLVSAFNSDDAFDWDEGFRGRGQFWFAIQGTDAAGALAEQDGGNRPDDSTPFAIPVIYNATYIGAGVGATPETDRAEALYFRDNSGGKYLNSIITDFQTADGGDAVRIENRDSGEDSNARLAAGDLVLSNNIWWDFGDGNTLTDIVRDEGGNQADIINHLTANSNVIQNPLIASVSRSTTPDGQLDPRPDAASPAFTADRAAYSTSNDDGFFREVSYIGAFGENNWLSGWTALDNIGYLGDLRDNTLGGNPTCVETGTNEGRPTCTITDASIAPGGDYVLDAAVTYILRGVVVVENGGILRIPAGTIIKAESGISSNASALLVARDAQIFAEGTANNPIIFTSIQDNLNGPDLLNYQSRGLWGGVVILGQAGTNNPEGLRSIEGINEIITDGREQYGGSDDNHSSGVFRYVSIRHTGINVGLSDGNEIQGLTVGAVGRGTRIEFVESYASGDDGFEFFGGTVDTKYLISAFNSDDAFDWDEGFRGRGQFWFAIQGTDAAGALAEQDGGNRPDDSTPFAIPVIYNATYIGAGVGATPETDRAEALYFRDNSGGKYLNSIITDFQTADGGDAVRIENRDSGEDSNARLAAGDLVLSNNIWWDFGDGNALEDIVRDEAGNQADIINHLISNANVVDDPRIAGVSRSTSPNGQLDPRPNAGSPAFTARRAAYSTGNDDGFFSEVSYIGAFGTVNWAASWSALGSLGYFGDLRDDTIGDNPNCVETGTNEGRPICVITDGSIVPGGDFVLDPSITYILRGVVVVEDGGVLRIPAGTIIKAEAGISSSASALVVARNAQIFAEGTARDPIIFTSIQDNLNGADLLNYQSRGLWGGVVMLGQAGTNNPEGLRSIEGVNEIITDGREQYGGTNDNHSSGVFRYVSIRHTGINVGLSDGNEIQGLTLGAVGRGTTIEYVESYSSGDDGFEFFGGTVDTRYLVSAFNSDDAFDWDEGFRGRGQFWFAIQGTDAAGALAEQDGGNRPDDSTPFAIPVIYNATLVGAGVGATPETDRAEALYFRDNSGGKYLNSIITDFQTADGGDAVRIENRDSGEDSNARLAAGDLMFSNNIWWAFGDGDTLEDIVRDEGGNQADIIAHLTANNNALADPMLGGVSRELQGNQGLDPRPHAAGPAYTNPLAAYTTSNDDSFFREVDYIGAFGQVNWLEGWTALADLDYLGDLASLVSVEPVAGEVPSSYTLSQNYPNPFNPSTTIRFSIPNAEHVRLAVYDMMGREIQVLVDGVQAAGEYNVTFDATNLASGMYIYRFQAANSMLTRTMTLLK